MSIVKVTPDHATSTALDQNDMTSAGVLKCSKQMKLESAVKHEETKKNLRDMQNEMDKMGQKCPSSLVRGLGPASLVGISSLRTQPCAERETLDAICSATTALKLKASIWQHYGLTFATKASECEAHTTRKANR